MELIPTTRFDKKLFSYHGGYLMYGSEENGKRKKFVARFKYKGAFTKAVFMKELIANHTVESYFMALDQGKAPLAILRDKNEDWYYDTMEKYAGRPVGREVA
jgi:hypothetical protein